MMNNNLKENKVVIYRLLKEFFSNRFVSILILMCWILSTILIIAAPKLAGEIMTNIYNALINKVITGKPMVFVMINKMLILLAAIYIIQFIIDLIKNSLLVSVWQKYVMNLRNRVNEKLLKLPIKFFEKTTNGTILSLMINDVENVNNCLTGIFRNIFTEFFKVIGATIMMFIISPTLAIMNIIMAIVGMIVTRIVVNAAEKHFNNKQKQIAVMNSLAEEMYTSKQTIQATAKEEFFSEEFKKQAEDLRRKTIKSNFIGSLADRIFALWSNIALSAIIVGAAILNIRGVIEIGVIYTLMNYTKLTIGSLKTIAKCSVDMLNTLVSLKRIYTFIEIEENKNSKLEDVVIKDQIVGKNINFAHAKGKYVLNDVDINVCKGKKIGIVGRTGSGKTTLANILMKVYDVGEGTLLADNISYGNINTESYNKNFSVIEQNINGFEDTVMENIKYGNNSMTSEEIITIAKKIGIDDIIMKLPNGYETIVDSKMPLGVKQLIILMQNLIATTNVLVMDEATNMLDANTKKKINDIVNSVKEEKIIIVIAHELDIIKDADWIYVLEEGKIVEQGTHNELVSSATRYKELFAYSI